MQVTGKMILDQIELLKDRTKTFDDEFANTLYAFKDEQKPSPEAVAEYYMRVQGHMAILQDAQARVNTTVRVTVLGAEYSMLEAIKLQGVYTRIANQWQTARSAKRKGHHYMDTEHVRGADQERADRTVTVEAAKQQMEAAKRMAKKFQNAVGDGNRVPVHLTVRQSLFDED